MSKFDIRKLSERDWLAYKSIRLESLRDSPDSFGSTYDHEASFAPEKWKSRLKTTPTMLDAVVVAAVANKKYIGLLSCVIGTPDTCRARLYQMWVSPEYRGSGVGTALIDRVRSWATARNVEKLVLSVTTTNSEAVSLYQSIGFTPFGSLEPLRAGSDLQSQDMTLNLDMRVG